MIKKFPFTTLIIFISIFLIYSFSVTKDTPFDYFTRLSISFAQGKLYLLENPSWLNELIPFNNKFFVVYPPMPAIILLPFTLLFKGNVSQTLISQIFGSLNAVLVYLLIKKLEFSNRTSILVAIFFALGTTHYFTASVGSAWFFSHIIALFFLLLSLLETFGKRRLILIGFLIGASFWSRSTIIFTLPFFYIFLKNKFLPLNKNNLINCLLLNFGIIFFILADSYYNFVRFGNFNILIPYELIPNIKNDHIFKDGFMSINFIERHIEALFFKLPKISDQFPYLIPSIYSMAIWFTSPAILYILKFKKSQIIISCWVAILTTLFVIWLWAGVGYSQFGYRFILDVMPFLIILLAYAFGQKPSKFAYFLVVLSILINIWGIFVINRLNIFTI